MDAIGSYSISHVQTHASNEKKDNVTLSSITIEGN